MTRNSVHRRVFPTIVSAIAFGFVLPVAKSEAALLVNGDARTHDILIKEGDRERAVALKAGAQLDDICADGCVLRINGGPEEGWELKGPERVTIEDGLLFYDGPVEVASPDEETGEAKSAQ